MVFSHVLDSDRSGAIGVQSSLGSKQAAVFSTVNERRGLRANLFPP